MNFLTIFRIFLLLFWVNPVSTSPTSSAKTDGAVSLNAERGGRQLDSAGKPPSPPFIDYGTFSDEEGQFGHKPAIHGDLDDDNEDWLKNLLTKLNESEEMQNESNTTNGLLASMSHLAQDHVGSNGSEMQDGTSGSGQMANSLSDGSASITYGSASGPEEITQNALPQFAVADQSSNHYNQQHQQHQYPAAGPRIMMSGLATPGILPAEEPRWFESGGDHDHRQRHQQQQQPKPHNKHQHEQQQRNQGEVRYADDQLRESQNDYPPGYGPQHPELPTNASFSMGAMHPIGKVLSKGKSAVRQRTLRARQHELRQLKKRPNHVVPQTEFAKTVQSLTGKTATERYAPSVQVQRQEGAEKPQARQVLSLIEQQKQLMQNEQQQQQRGQQQYGQTVIGIDDGIQLLRYDPMHDEANIHYSRLESTREPNEAPVPTAAGAESVKGDGGGREGQQKPDIAHQQMAPMTASIRRGHPAAIAYSSTATHAVMAHQPNPEGATTATAQQLKGKDPQAAKATVQGGQRAKVLTATVKAQQLKRTKVSPAAAETARQLKGKKAPEAAAAALQPKVQAEAVMVQRSQRTKMPSATGETSNYLKRNEASEATLVAAKQQSGVKEGPSRLPELTETGPKRIKYVTPLKGRTIILREQEEGIHKVDAKDFKDKIRRLTGNGGSPQNDHEYRPQHLDQPKAHLSDGIMDISSDSDDETTSFPQQNNSDDNGIGTDSMVLETSSDYGDQLEHLLLAESHDAHGDNNASNNSAAVVADNHPALHYDNLMDDVEFDHLLAQSHLFTMDHEVDDNVALAAGHDRGNFGRQQAPQLQREDLPSGWHSVPQFEHQPSHNMGILPQLPSQGTRDGNWNVQQNLSKPAMP